MAYSSAGSLTGLLDGFFTNTASGSKPKATNRFGTIIPGEAQARIDAGEPWLADRLLLGEGDMRSMAGDIAAEEKRRYESGVGTLTTQFNQSNAALNSQIDPDLLFSKAADDIGARGSAALNNLRSSFGARGLSPNSGAGSGALSRLLYQQDAAFTGAKRDIAIENQNRRAINAAQSFANALNLASFVNSPVGGVGLETEQNIFEGLLAQKGIAEQRKSAKEANSTNKTAGYLQAGAGLAGGLIGLI